MASAVQVQRLLASTETFTSSLSPIDECKAENAHSSHVRHEVYKYISF